AGRVAKGEVIVFSDANAMYEPDALKKLVRNFSDKRVGYVVGEARYNDTGSSSSSQSENFYWQYEIFLKKCESNLHSIVGGDGALYAVRRELYEDLLVTDINDFVNPLQIVLKGYRGVYEPAAVCWEDAAGSFSGEFKRKVRIVNRSFSGLMRLKGVLNPFKTGFFSFEIFSHKLLRWFAPFFIFFFVLAVFALALPGNLFYQWASLFAVFFFECSYIGFVKRASKKNNPIFFIPYYFVAVNIAALRGVAESAKGNIQSTWDSVRPASQTDVFSQEKLFLGVHLLGGLGVLFACWLLKEIIPLDISFAKFGFWGALLAMVYIYFGYPCVLFVLGFFKNRRVKKQQFFPNVTLLVCAFNEEKVIREKIENMLSLDYPEGKLNFAVASDGSDDRTASIVTEYGDPRLQFFDYPVRRGKVSVISDTLPKLSGEIIVLSDANTMFQEDAVQTLVRSFHDPDVGGVSSDVILLNEGTTYGESESAYYKYERWIQKSEAKIGSIIGADGGMYGIRKSLFLPPSPNIILDDFVISMNVVNQGYRLVYDEQAVACEQSNTTWKEEFSRKSRVIAGAVQVLKQGEGIPALGFSTPFFCFVSHKLLRWMVPFFMLLFFVTNVRVFLHSDYLLYSIILFGQFFFYALALAGLIVEGSKKTLLKIPFYFCLVNGAALYGIFKGVFNRQSVKWKKVSR
ncbi:MAG: glycosyltransferase, partial [Nitrospinota bacterium]